MGVSPGGAGIVTVMKLIGVKWFGEIKFWFALIKVATLTLFLVIGSIILGVGSSVGHPMGSRSLIMAASFPMECWCADVGSRGPQSE
ncbi:MULTISPECIES: hypothetical protein [unclassified Pseudomonas]|uniref:hypothetical protein n=1 Tax=unclassified Pseudomonas TaxID=196821 RepID=UPI002115C14F|nr:MULTISPECIES: hypothetical protein [unclassified Pseudomonas]